MLTATILIVDDDTNLRITLAIILRQAGYQVCTANSAAVAMELLATTSFDLVILDVNLPDIDGFTLLSRIRLVSPGIPALVLSGQATQDSLNTENHPALQGFLGKPVDPDTLLSFVRQILCVIPCEFAQPSLK